MRTILSKGIKIKKSTIFKLQIDMRICSIRKISQRNNKFIQIWRVW